MQRNGRAGIWTQSRLIPALGYFQLPSGTHVLNNQTFWCSCVGFAFAFEVVLHTASTLDVSHYIFLGSYDQKDYGETQRMSVDASILSLLPRLSEVTLIFCPTLQNRKGYTLTRTLKRTDIRRMLPLHLECGIFSLMSGLASSSGICLKSPL